MGYGTVDHYTTLVLYPPGGTEDIAQSMWNSRAWTFQEGFYAKRRLFFTDRQVMFICDAPNNSVHYEADDLEVTPSGQRKDIISPRGILREHDYDLSSLEVLLTAYCGRTLTYDKDALNAISSTLNAMTRMLSTVWHDETSYTHLWGVPIQFHPDSFRVALNWYHPQPARRRHGFPSWSPLGWDGAVNWAAMQHYLHDGDCSLWTSSGSQQMCSLLAPVPARTQEESPESHISEQPRCLQMTAYSCWVDVVTDSTIDVKTSYIGLPIQGRKQTMLEVHWDTVPTEPATSSLLAIALWDRHSSHFLYAILLILEPAGDSYRRVGLSDTRSAFSGGIHNSIMQNVTRGDGCGVNSDKGKLSDFDFDLEIRRLWIAVSEERTMILS